MLKDKEANLRKENEELKKDLKALSDELCKMEHCQNHKLIKAIQNRWKIKPLW